MHATEVRNNLVAASINLSKTQATLKDIEIPYYTDNDFQTLQTLSTGIFNDMDIIERQQYVHRIIQISRKRAAALCQWIDQVNFKYFIFFAYLSLRRFNIFLKVIEKSILIEYAHVHDVYYTATRKLKLERVRIMQEKIKEATGKDINIKLFGNYTELKNRII